MINIKRAAAAGILAFAMAASLPANVSADKGSTINRIQDVRNVITVNNRTCSLDELKESLVQIAVKGDCFKWGVIVGGSQNTKPDEDKNETDSSKPNDNIEEDNNENDNGNNNGSEEDNNKPDEDINDNEINKPDTKPEDNNVQKPIFSETDEEEGVQSSYIQQVVSLVNIERAKEGLAPLSWSQSISKAAAIRAKEIQTSFSHTRPNGSHFATVLGENGVTYRGTGENIAWGQKTPEQVVKAWMNSTGHRANIMNPSFNNIGVGYEENSSKTPYWVQLFTY